MIHVTFHSLQNIHEKDVGDPAKGSKWHLHLKLWWIWRPYDHNGNNHNKDIIYKGKKLLQNITNMALQAQDLLMREHSEADSQPDIKATVNFQELLMITISSQLEVPIQVYLWCSCYLGALSTNQEIKSQITLVRIPCTEQLCP